MNDKRKAGFTRMADGTKEDYMRILDDEKLHAAGMADRILDYLRTLTGGLGGYQVDRLTHSLQTATLAQRAGRDEEYVVCALVHDIGDHLAFYNHADLAAAVVKPYVSEQNHWMVEKHAVFQGYFFWHHYGDDRNTRDRYRDHPWFEYTAEFCEKFDQCAFDPHYDTLPLEAFEPMVRRVFEKPRFETYIQRL